MIVKFENTELNVIEDAQHEWLLDTALVAKGYGTSTDSILKHLQRKKGELIEGKHFLRGVDNLSTTHNQVFWTKRGVIRLGFFIRSNQAKSFRDFAEDLVINKIEQKPLSQIEILVQSAQLLLEQEKRLTTVENKVDRILTIHEEAERELKALPIASEVVPELPLRGKIRLLVNRYCSYTGMIQKTVWDNVYQTLLYNYHISIKSYKKDKNESWLDVAERRGFLDKIYIVVSNLLHSQGLSNN